MIKYETPNVNSASRVENPVVNYDCKDAILLEEIPRLLDEENPSPSGRVPGT